MRLFLPTRVKRKREKEERKRGEKEKREEEERERESFFGSLTGTRTLVFRVRAEYPNQLDYRGALYVHTTQLIIYAKGKLRKTLYEH